MYKEDFSRFDEPSPTLFDLHKQRTEDFEDEIFTRLYKNETSNLTTVFLNDDFRLRPRRLKNLLKPGNTPIQTFQSKISTTKSKWNFDLYDPVAYNYDLSNIGSAMQTELKMIESVWVYYPDRVNMISDHLNPLSYKYAKELERLLYSYLRSSESSLIRGDFYLAYKFFNVACSLGSEIQKVKEKHLTDSIKRVTSKRPNDIVVGYIPSSSHRIEAVRYRNLYQARVTYMPSTLYDMITPYTFNTIVNRKRAGYLEITKGQKIKALIGEKLLGSMLNLISPEDVYTDGLIIVDSIRDFLRRVNTKHDLSSLENMVRRYGFVNGALKFGNI